MEALWEEIQEPTRTLGSNIGFAFVKMSPHTMAYLLKGLNDRIDKYEQMPKPLADDDQDSFETTIGLRDSVRATRDKTLESE